MITKSILQINFFHHIGEYFFMCNILVNNFFCYSILVKKPEEIGEEKDESVEDKDNDKEENIREYAYS